MMFKALLKVVSFGVLFVLTLHLLFKMLPFYWGNNHVAKKFRYLRTVDKKPKTYFLGSSSIQRGVIPEVFDSLVHTSDFSFNISSDGTQADQLFYLLDNLLEDDHVETIFFELNDFDSMHKNRYLTTKTKYCSTPLVLNNQLKYAQELSTIEQFEKDTLKKKYVNTFIENLFKIGYRKDIINNLKDQKGVNSFGKIQGFVATAKDQLPESKRQRVEKLLKTIADVIKRAQKQERHNYNQTILDLAYKYLNKSLNSGKKLIFIFGPKFTHGVTPAEMYATFDLLPPENRINMADPNKFPQFYNIENRFDQSHFNKRGAKIFTETLAHEYIKLTTDGI